MSMHYVIAIFNLFSSPQFLVDKFFHSLDFYVPPFRKRPCSTISYLQVAELSKLKTTLSLKTLTLISI